MSESIGAVGASGELEAVLVRGGGLGERAPLGWRVRNALRWAFVWGLVANRLAYWFTRLTGIPTITCELEAVLLRADGQRVRFGVVGRRVVTDTGVGFIVDDWDNSAVDVTNLNYHACGTGTNAEAAGDTALQTEATGITSRQAGTKSQPAANQLRSTATQSFTGPGAITEHGLLSAASSGVLWDRTVAAAINVGSGDAITWTHTTTINSGG